MSTITREMIKEFREDFLKLNKAIEMKYGVALKVDKISYGSDSFSFNVKAFSNSSGDDISVEQLEFNKLCPRYGFKPSDYMREFEYNNQIFKLIGFLPKAKKYPYIGLSHDGCKYKLPEVNFI